MSKNNYLILESDKACQMLAASYLTDSKQVSYFRGQLTFNTWIWDQTKVFKKTKILKVQLLHKVKSNQVSHGAWSVVNI